jgi:signal transduction histidine kinase
MGSTSLTGPGRSADWPMLDAFVIANRDEIIARARARVASRTTPIATDVELANGIPMFLDQLGDALRLARSSILIDHEKLTRSAGQHGHDLLRMGLTVGQVVQDYGDVCQTITELAVEQKFSISAEQFKTLNLCIDDAIAGAVTEYARHRESAIENHGIERLGALAHEMRNLLAAATLSFETLQTGLVAPGGSTGRVLGRSLTGMADLIDRSLADVRLDAGLMQPESIVVAAFIEEVQIVALMQATARGITFEVVSADDAVVVEADRPILAAALANLLQNAFKFTRRGGHVTLTVRATADRVLFEIEDECGGLPPGKTEELFRPFEQRGSNRSGVGLGLSICLRAAKANHGQILVRDLPGKGCVFTLDLPKTLPARSLNS